MIKNREVVVVHESELVSCRIAFNLFWETNVNIIYVVDDDDCFQGVITDRSLLKQIKENEQEKPFINKKCTVIRNKEDDSILDEALELFKKYHITTAIPVIDESGKICFEIRRNEPEDEKPSIAEFQNKIANYEKSYYLRDEIVYLKRLLDNQDIVVIGTEEQFDDMFGCLRLSKCRIHFMVELKNAYEFMSKNGNLMIDLTSTGYSGREDIYNHCNNGYLWKQFIFHIYKAVELEYCSRLYRILDNESITLKDFLEKYMVREIIISKRSIFTATILDYLRKCHFYVEDQKGIYRKESQYGLKMNGIELDKEIWVEEVVIDFTNLILQLFILNKQLAGRMNILNFVFDNELKASIVEENRIGGVTLEDTWEYGELYTLGKNINETYLAELRGSLRFDCARSFENDRVIFKDTDSRWVHIENGIRRTCFQPENYKGTIYFLGGCTIFGVAVEDAYTIPSIIQKKINQSGRKYRVVNLANNLINASKILEALDIKDGDIFVVLFPAVTDSIKENIPIMEIGDQFNKLRMNRYEGVECFSDMVQHCGTNGNIIYSEIIFEELKKYLVDEFDKPLFKNKIHSVFNKNYKDLDILYGYGNYTAQLQQRGKEYVTDKQKKVGCIVMNCNPFTLGHRYLVEYALSKVDCLYLFVVEEDKSFFSFADRYEMVCRGTEDLENIIVIGSGNMIVTSITFSAYFQRKNLSPAQNYSLDMDLRVFSQYIAPAANIKYRFVGEEPIDPVTAKYNIKMKEILSEFGIQVIEIPRKHERGEVISASKVRELYRKNDYKNIRGLVPETTLQYLIHIRDSLQ